jgi:hypothetical protein
MLRMGPSRYQARVLRVLESNTTRAYEEALLSVAERVVFRSREHFSASGKRYQSVSTSR